MFRPSGSLRVTSESYQIRAVSLFLAGNGQFLNYLVVEMSTPHAGIAGLLSWVFSEEQCGDCMAFSEHKGIG